MAHLSHRVDIKVAVIKDQFSPWLRIFDSSQGNLMQVSLMQGEMRA